MLNIFRGSCLLFGITTLLGGCSSAPQPTQADIPLVHASLAYSLSAEQDVAINIPQIDAASHSGAKVGINHNGSRYYLNERYVSALGHECIRFSLANQADIHPSVAPARLTACNRNGQWAVISPLVASTEE